MASDYQKPHGLTVITWTQAEFFQTNGDISKFHGGKKDSRTSSSNGRFYTGADLLEVPEVTLIDRFGRLGYDLYQGSYGIHNSTVKSTHIRKSIGEENLREEIHRAEEYHKKNDSYIRKSRSHNPSTRKSTGKIVILKTLREDFNSYQTKKSCSKNTRC